MLVGFMLVPTFVFADEEVGDDELREHESGELRINNETIQDGQIVEHDQFRPILHEVAPFLFLEDLTAIEAQRVAQNAEFITTVHERAFLDEVPDIGFDTSEIVSRLFLDEEAFEDRLGSLGSPERYFHIPPWVIAIGIVTATAFLAYVAVILGQKLGHMIYTKKEGEEVNG